MKTKYISRENVKPDRRRSPGLPDKQGHPGKGAPNLLLRTAGEEMPAPREVRRFTQESLILCPCFPSAWEKSQVSTPKTTMSSQILLRPQALDRQQRPMEAKGSQGTFSRPVTSRPASPESSPAKCAQVF